MAHTSALVCRSLVLVFVLLAVGSIALAQQPGQQSPQSLHQLDESLLDATTREWLAEFGRLGTGSTPDAKRWRDNEGKFKTVLHACVSKPPECKAVTIVGRIGVSGAKPVDPRAIVSPCAILEGGFFATRVDDGVATLPFRLPGYEPLDLPLKPGATGVVNVGQITLKPLPRKSAVTAVGRIELEDDPDVSGRPKVQVVWNIMAERLTEEVRDFGYEYDWRKTTDPIQQRTQEEVRLHHHWTYCTRSVMNFGSDREEHVPTAIVTPVGRDGRFRTAGLVPAFYQAVVSAPGYITTAFYADLTDKDGKTAELDPMPLLVAKSFTNSIGMEFVRIPPGKFPAKPYYDGDKAPALLTVAKEFYISRHEFSRGQYETLTGSLGTDFGVPHDKETNDHPLRLLIKPGKPSIDLEPAFRICRLLTEAHEEKAAGRTYRLPEEREWVHACRAGTRTRYPAKTEELVDYLWNDASAETLKRPAALSSVGFGPNAIRAHGGSSLFEAMGMPGNMYETSINSLRPQGKGTPNPWGLYNMQGNVREVCIKWLEPQDAVLWKPSSSRESTDVGDGWQVQLAGFNDRFHSSVFSTQDGDSRKVGEIRVRGGGYMSVDLECLRGRSLRGSDYGVGLRVVCTIAE